MFQNDHIALSLIEDDISNHNTIILEITNDRERVYNQEIEIHQSTVINA